MIFHAQGSWNTKDGVTGKRVKRELDFPLESSWLSFDGRALKERPVTTMTTLQKEFRMAAFRPGRLFLP